MVFSLKNGRIFVVKNYGRLISIGTARDIHRNHATPMHRNSKCSAILNDTPHDESIRMTGSPVDVRP
ncbi:hypothetical protein [Burkholderia orbicola]|uniref:hypothetical protein n=1 Tax=Burkholderia orbicola TaxID=2978683 RepID=UPI002656F8BC|nr:hypothetical protein [Burkholderia orbicola]MDN7560935.1 hypothetical protein [Burkholderia orbicola]